MAARGGGATGPRRYIESSKESSGNGAEPNFGHVDVPRQKETAFCTCRRCTLVLVLTLSVQIVLGLKYEFKDLFRPGSEGWEVLGGLAEEADASSAVEERQGADTAAANASVRAPAPAPAAPSPGPPRVPPAGVQLPPGWTEPWGGPAERRSALADSTIGFYFPVFNQVPGVLQVLESVRRFYPDSPVHLLSDGGKRNFTEVCKLPKYGCTFEWLPPENSRWNPHSWVSRLRSVALRLGTKFVIYLEPDVLVRRRHRVEPAHDAGGIYDNFNPAMKATTLGFLQSRGQEVNPCFKVRWNHFGLAGGSYFRTEAVLDAFDPAHVRHIDWTGFSTAEGHRAYSSDFAMHVAFSLRGWTVFPWPEAAQQFSKDKRGKEKVDDETFGQRYPAFNPEAAFEHNHKEGYKDTVPADEASLITWIKTGDSVGCHSCVWYTGPLLEERLPIPSPPPAVESDHDRFQPALYKDTVPPPNGPSPEDQCRSTPPTGKIVPAAPNDPALPPAAPVPRVEAAPPAANQPALPPVAPVAQVEAADTAPGAVRADPAIAGPGPGRVEGAVTASGTGTELPPAVADSLGLPRASEPAAPWVHQADVMVVGLPSAGGSDGRRFLLAQTVLMNQNNVWGDNSDPNSVTRPRWLRACIGTNRFHVAGHGHAMVLRWNGTVEIPQRWRKKCNTQEDIPKCLRSAAHETFNWEKHRMMSDYLRSPRNFSHVLVLDADAAVVHRSHDTLAKMAQELEDQGKELLLTSEDWQGKNGAKRVNGGLLFAKNTPFTQALFEDMLEAHFNDVGNKAPKIGGEKMVCGGNEQICLNGVLGRADLKSKTFFTSGRTYNRGGCVLSKCGGGQGDPDGQMKALGMGDPSLEIMHFMGTSKFQAPKVLCDNNSSWAFTGESPQGYSCTP